MTTHNTVVTTGHGNSTANTGAKKNPVPTYHAEPARSEIITNRSQRGTGAGDFPAPRVHTAWPAPRVRAACPASRVRSAASPVIVVLSVRSRSESAPFEVAATI